MGALSGETHPSAIVREKLDIPRRHDTLQPTHATDLACRFPVTGITHLLIWLLTPMFDRFSAKCAVEAFEKAWTVGIERLLQAHVTDEFAAFGDLQIWLVSSSSA